MIRQHTSRQTIQSCPTEVSLVVGWATCRSTLWHRKKTNGFISGELIGSHGFTSRYSSFLYIFPWTNQKTMKIRIWVERGYWIAQCDKFEPICWLQRILRILKICWMTVWKQRTSSWLLFVIFHGCWSKPSLLLVNWCLNIHHSHWLKTQLCWFCVPTTLFFLVPTHFLLGWSLLGQDV